MPGRVKRDLHAVYGYAFSVWSGLDAGLIPQTDAVERLALFRHQVGAVAAICMI